VAELQLAPQRKHEQGGKNMSRENNAVVLHGTQQPIGVQREQKQQQVQRIKGAGLHLAGEAVSGQGIRIPNGKATGAD